MRTVEEIAEDLLRCALGWEPDARLLGNVKADEIAYLAEKVLTGKVESLEGTRIKINDCKFGPR